MSVIPKHKNVSAFNIDDAIYISTSYLTVFSKNIQTEDYCYFALCDFNALLCMYLNETGECHTH